MAAPISPCGPKFQLSPKLASLLTEFDLKMESIVTVLTDTTSAHTSCDVLWKLMALCGLAPFDAVDAREKVYLDECNLQMRLIPITGTEEFTTVAMRLPEDSEFFASRKEWKRIKRGGLLCLARPFIKFSGHDVNSSRTIAFKPLQTRWTRSILAAACAPTRDVVSIIQDLVTCTLEDGKFEVGVLLSSFFCEVSISWNEHVNIIEGRDTAEGRSRGRRRSTAEAEADNAIALRGLIAATRPAAVHLGSLCVSLESALETGYLLTESATVVESIYQMLVLGDLAAELVQTHAASMFKMCSRILKGPCTERPRRACWQLLLELVARNGLCALSRKAIVEGFYDYTTNLYLRGTVQVQTLLFVVTTCLKHSALRSEETVVCLALEALGSLAASQRLPDGRYVGFYPEISVSLPVRYVDLMVVWRTLADHERKTLSRPGLREAFVRARHALVKELECCLTRVVVHMDRDWFLCTPKMFTTTLRPSLEFMDETGNTAIVEAICSSSRPDLWVSTPNRNYWRAAMDMGSRWSAARSAWIVGVMRATLARAARCASVAEDGAVRPPAKRRMT